MSGVWRIKLWAQSRKGLAHSGTFSRCLPLLLLEPYEGGVSLAQKARGAQRRLMSSLKLWVRRSSAGVGPFFSGQETNNQESTDPHLRYVTQQ